MSSSEEGELPATSYFEIGEAPYNELDDDDYEKGYYIACEWAPTASPGALNIAVNLQTFNEQLKSFIDLMNEHDGCVDAFVRSVTGSPDYSMLDTRGKSKVDVLFEESVTFFDHDELDSAQLEQVFNELSSERQEVAQSVLAVKRVTPRYQVIDEDFHFVLVYEDKVRARLPVSDIPARAFRMFYDGWSKGVKDYVQQNPLEDDSDQI